MCLLLLQLFGQSLKPDDSLLEELIYYYTVISPEVLSPTNAIELDLFPWVRFFGHQIFKKLKDFKEYHMYGTLKQLLQNSQVKGVPCLF